MWRHAWRGATARRLRGTLEVPRLCFPRSVLQQPQQHAHFFAPQIPFTIGSRGAPMRPPSPRPSELPVQRQAARTFSSLAAVEAQPAVAAGAAPSFPEGEIEEISIPDRMRMIAWLAQHNAVDLSFLRARAKRSGPLDLKDARPVDYSWIELTLLLSDPKASRLRDVFRQASLPEALRSGRLLEVLDCFAGDVAFSYCRPAISLNSNKTDLFVTVAIDSIRLFTPEQCMQPHATTHAGTTDAADPYISVNKDLTLRGFVSYAGTSSVEIIAELHQVCEPALWGVHTLEMEGRLIGSACLVFVHVDREGRPKKCIPPLIKTSTNPEVSVQLRGAEARQQARKERMTRKDLAFRGPDQQEAEFLHSTWIATSSSSRKLKKIQDTRLDSNILMQPETISMYGRAFGGYIMRSALELSFLTAQRFLQKTAPVIIGMEDIRFFDAVKLGDTLHLCSHVVWSDKDEFQIQVVASSSSVGSPFRRTNQLVFYYKQVRTLRNTSLNTKTSVFGARRL
ncbi:hypothetical protein ACSSS7_001057 [Eimeria intestinalis]